MEGIWAASFAALWFVVVLLCVVVVALARQIGKLHLRLGPTGALEIDDEGPPLGARPPARTTTDVDGNEIVFGGSGAARLALFVTPGCRLCNEVLPGLAAAARHGGLLPIVVSDGDTDRTRRAYGDRHAAAPLIADERIVQDLRVPGTPYAVVTDVEGVVRAKGTVNDLEQLEGLIDTARVRTEEAAVKV